MRYVVLVALLAAVTVTSIAAAGSSATKQRVQIDMRSKEFAGETFVLTPLKAGAIERDSGGTQGCVYESHRTVVRDGQKGHIWECPDWTLVGKHGKIVLHTRYTWNDAWLYNIATGTWKVVSGTGQYARITGAGRSAYVGGGTWMRARYQGFLTSP